MSSSVVWPLCFIKSTINAAVYQDVLEHFMLLLYGDADFIFQQDSAPAQTAKSTNTWFNDHRITLLDWPANATDLNHHIICMGCQEEDERHKTQQYGRSEGRYRRNRGFHNTSAGQKAAMPLRINAVIHAKGAHHKNILFRRPTFKKIIFVCWSYVIF